MKAARCEFVGDIIDLFEDADKIWIVLEYIDGRNLLQELSEHSKNPEKIVIFR